MHRAFAIDVLPCVHCGGRAAPDRHAARFRRHPEDRRAPGPRPLGAESRPGPTRAQRRRALIASGRGARAADLPPLAASRRSSPSGLLCRVRPSGRLTAALRPGYDAAQPARRSQLARNPLCALRLWLRAQRGDDREQPARQGRVRTRWIKPSALLNAAPGPRSVRGPRETTRSRTPVTLNVARSRSRRFPDSLAVPTLQRDCSVRVWVRTSEGRGPRSGGARAVRV
jgi:hypothetical protein